MCLKSWLQELWGYLFPPAWQGVRKKGEGCAGLRDRVSGGAGQAPPSWPAVQQAGAAAGRPVRRRGLRLRDMQCQTPIWSTEVWGSCRTAARTVPAWLGCLCRALSPALAGSGAGATAAAGPMDSLGLMEQQLVRECGELPPSKGRAAVSCTVCHDVVKHK